MVVQQRSRDAAFAAPRERLYRNSFWLKSQAVRLKPSPSFYVTVNKEIEKAINLTGNQKSN